MAVNAIKEAHWVELQRKADELAALAQGKVSASLHRDLTLFINQVQRYQRRLERQNTALRKSRDAIAKAKKSYEALYNKYANLFELTPHAYVVFDQAGIICEANLTAAIMLNLPKSNLIGQSMARFIHGDDQAAFHRLKHDCRNAVDPRIAELKLVQPGGRHIPAQIQMMSLPRRNQSGNEFRAVILDLSEQERISADLSLLHQCLEIAVQATDAHQLVEVYVQQIKHYAKCSAVGIRLRDEAGRIPYQAYDGFSRQFHESENALSLHSDQCMCIDVIKGRADPSKPFFTSYGSLYINGTSRFLADVQPEEFGHNTRNVCNAAGYESVALVPISVDRNITGLIHVADRRENMFPRQLVEVLEQAAMRLGLALQRLHMQSRLSENVESLRELSSHLMKAKEEEQRRIAMELHDQTGQDLSVLKLRLKQLHDRLRKDQPALKQSCADMMRFTDEIIGNVRRMTQGLNPAVLEALGLKAAVKQTLREFTHFSGIRIQTSIEPLERVHDREIQISLFRIVQEALTNIHKHAQATCVKIRAVEDPHGVRVVIEDDGIGFDFIAITSASIPEKGMGLAAMQLRGCMIGAQIDIQSRHGQGTRITVNLPAGSIKRVS